MPELVKGYFTKRDDKGRAVSCEEKELYKGDLHDAVQRFPQEWSHKPVKVQGEEPAAAAVTAKPARKPRRGGRKPKPTAQVVATAPADQGSAGEQSSEG